MHQKILLFKERTKGKRNGSISQNKEEDNEFIIDDEISFEDMIRKEIDHIFIMMQLLNTIVLKGDETYRTM